MPKRAEVKNDKTYRRDGSSWMYRVYSYRSHNTIVQDYIDHREVYKYIVCVCRLENQPAQLFRLLLSPPTCSSSLAHLLSRRLRHPSSPVLLLYLHVRQLMKSFLESTSFSSSLRPTLLLSPLTITLSVRSTLATLPSVMLLPLKRRPVSRKSTVLGTSRAMPVLLMLRLLRS